MEEIIEILNRFSKETLEEIIEKANRNERLTNYEISFLYFLKTFYEKEKEIEK